MGRTSISVGVNLACLSIVLGAAASWCAAQGNAVVMSSGSRNRLWVAQNENYKDGNQNKVKATFRTRELPGNWQDMGLLDGGIEAMASFQTDAAVLLAQGQWKRMGSSLVSGTPIPGEGPVLAWGAMPNALLAVRGHAGGKAGHDDKPAASVVPAPIPPPPVATAPAATTSSTRPQTRPATRPVTPVLFRHAQGQWAAVADIPDSGPATAIAVGSLGEVIVVALLIDPTTVRTYARGPAAWMPLGEIKLAKVTPATPVKIALVAGTSVIYLWAVDQDGKMWISSRSRSDGENWGDVKPLNVPGHALPASAPRTLASAGDELHLIMLKDNKLWEQRYDLAGTPRGNPSELPLAVAKSSGTGLWMLQMFVLAVVVTVLIVAVYRRRNQQRDPDQESKPPRDDEE